MTRVCELTGKRRLVANKVSHSNNKTKIKKEVNLHSKKIFDPATGKTVKLRLCTRAIRNLDKMGSLTKLLKKSR
jgi:large subunit ribosomal protein L28